MSLERLDDFLLTAQRLKVKGLLSEDHFIRETTPESIVRYVPTRDHLPKAGIVDLIMIVLKISIKSS
jgi:hypothetical protein